MCDMHAADRCRPHRSSRLSTSFCFSPMPFTWPPPACRSRCVHMRFSRGSSYVAAASSTCATATQSSQHPCDRSGNASQRAPVQHCTVYRHNPTALCDLGGTACVQQHMLPGPGRGACMSRHAASGAARQDAACDAKHRSRRWPLTFPVSGALRPHPDVLGCAYVGRSSAGTCGDGGDWTARWRP